MAVLRSTDALRNAMLQALADLIDAGVGPGTIKVYTGAMPADADDALSGQTLLATLTFSDPSPSGIAGGVLTFDTISDDVSADATGTATWARIQDSTGTNVFDCDVGATGSGATIEFNTVSFVAGGPVSITSFTITAPAG